MKTNLWTNNWNRAGKMLCALCAVALSATFTGCEYDDTELNKRVDQLEQRIVELEKSMTTQIGALQQMIEGKITIVSCTYDKAKGIYTIVLSNGDTLTVADSGNSSSVIGIIQEDGAYYWTLNGEPMADAAGNKLPVAVTPGVRVNTATNEWEISPDGGKTWLSTGIKAEEGVSLFAKVEEDEGFVYFTLGDGTRLKVARSTDFRCTPLAGKQYFKAGQRRSIKLDMSDVKKSTVTKPDGWKAVVENNELKITAPPAENSYAETKGKVAVVAVASNGQSSISEVSVEIGNAPHEITIDADLNVNITIDPDLAQDWEYEGYYYGVRKLGEFSPEQVIEDIKNDTRTRAIKTPVSTTLENLLGAKPEQGISYVVYVVDENYGDAGPELDAPEDMIYIIAQSIFAQIEISDVTYENARLSVEAMGVSQCWASVVPAEDYAPEQILIDIQDSWDAPAKVPAIYTGWLSQYAGGINIIPGKEYLVWVLPIAPGKDLDSYTKENIYTQKVTIRDITPGGSASVEIGEVTSTMTKVSATITPGSGVYKYYSAYKTELEYSGTRDEDWIKELIWSGTPTTAPNTYDIMREGLTPDAKGYFLSVAVTKDGTAGPLVRKNADAAPLTFSTEKITATSTEVNINDAKITLSGSSDIVSFRCINLMESDWIYGFPWLGDEKIIESELALVEQEDYNFKFFDAVNGSTVVSLPFPDPYAPSVKLSTGMPYFFFAIGIDKNGFPTELAKVEYIPTIPSDKFVREGADLWNANYDQRPQLSNLKVIPVEGYPGSNYAQIITDVTVGEKCAAYWIYAGIDDPAAGVVGAQNKTVKILAAFETQKFTGNQTQVVLNDWANMITNNIYVVWQDTDGIYYQFEKTVFPEPPVE